MRDKGDNPPSETTQGWSAPRIFDPRNWAALTPAFGQYRSIVDGPNNLVANNHAATWWDRDVHEGLLRLGLVASDGTVREPGAAVRQELNIRVPLNWREGCSIEPPYDGHWYAWRSDLEERTTIPSPAARAEAGLASARTPPTKPVPTPPVEPPPNASGVDKIVWASLRLRVEASDQLRLRGDALRNDVYNRITPGFTASRSSWTRAMAKVHELDRRAASDEQN